MMGQSKQVRGKLGQSKSGQSKLELGRLGQGRLGQSKLEQRTWEQSRLGQRRLVPCIPACSWKEQRQRRPRQQQ